jgi:hypothetical protein
MTESGRVLEVKGNTVTILKDSDLRGEACFGCMAGGTCEAKPFPVSAENPLGLPLKPGQTVEIESGRLFLEALAALLPLLAGFAAGFFLAVPLLFPASGESARAAGGAFFMLAAAACRCLFRRPPRNRLRVVRVKT